MRYLPLSETDRQDMLSAIGVKSVKDLFRDVQEAAWPNRAYDLPDHQDELGVERALTTMAAKNHAAPDGPFFLGAGCYYHHVPASVDYIIQRSEFLTSYTPYQPEMMQGTLQMIFEYQTMIARITGMDIANASLYDGATATVEAALMAMRLTRRSSVALATPLHPHYREVLDTYAHVNGSNIMEYNEGLDLSDCAAIIVQTPDFYGECYDLKKWREICDQAGAKLIIVVTEIMSLGMLPTPREADIVCGEAQSIGLPMSYGGPHLGFFACRQEYMRQLPGRLVGETVDADGNRGYVLTLNTREQHIRREKATSNICTNQGLCALAFTVHMALLGEEGFKRLAKINHKRAQDLAVALEKIDGVKVMNKTYFNEFVVELPRLADELQPKLLEQGIVSGHPLDSYKMLFCATEMTTDEDIIKLTMALKSVF